MAEEHRTRVTILTGTYRVKGFVALVPGARLTDYMIDSKTFVAVTDAEVREGDRLVMHVPFLNVRRDQIQIIAPD
jgi:DUF917 family protein